MVRNGARSEGTNLESYVNPSLIDILQPNSGSEHVESTAKRYTNILESIESSCNQILQLSDSCNIEMQSSRQIQERLYDEYNSVSKDIFSFVFFHF